MEQYRNPSQELTISEMKITVQEIRISQPKSLARSYLKKQITETRISALVENSLHLGILSTRQISLRISEQHKASNVQPS